MAQKKDRNFSAIRVFLEHTEGRKNMKTHTLSIIASLAAVVAVALVPVSAAAASIALTVTGLLTTMLADYGRPAVRYATPAPVVAFAPRAQAGLRQAA
jgi:hypothetical protein